MIITCQQCLTSYRLDENQLENTGSRVRCTGCGYIFLSFPPGSDPPPVVGKVAPDPGKAPSVPDVPKKNTIASKLSGSVNDLDFLQDTTTELEALGVTGDPPPWGEKSGGDRVVAADSEKFGLADIDGMLDFDDDPVAEPEVASLDSISESMGSLDGLNSDDLDIDGIEGVDDFDDAGSFEKEEKFDFRLESDEQREVVEEEEGDLGVADIEDLLDLGEDFLSASAKEPEREADEDTVDLDMDQILKESRTGGDETPPDSGENGGIDIGDWSDEEDVLEGPAGDEEPELLDLEGIEELTDADMMTTGDDIAVGDELDLGDLEDALDASEEPGEGNVSGDQGDLDLDIDFDLGEEEADELDLDMDLDLGLDEDAGKPSDKKAAIGDSVDLDVALALGGGGSEDQDIVLDMDLGLNEDKPGELDDLDIDLDMDLDSDEDQPGELDDLDLALDLEMETGERKQESKAEVGISGIEEVLELDENQDLENLQGMDSNDFDMDLEEEDGSFGEEASEIGLDSEDLDIEDIESMLDINADPTKEQSDAMDAADELDLADIESVLDLSTEESFEPEDEELSLDMQMITATDKGTGESGFETEELDISDIEKMLDLDGDTAEIPLQEEDEKELKSEPSGQGLDLDFEMEPVSLARTGDNVTANIEDSAALNGGDVDDMFELADDPEADGDSLDMDLDLDMSLDVDTDEHEALVDLPMSEDTAELDLSEYDEPSGGNLGAGDGEIFDTTDLDLDIEIDESSADETSPGVAAEAEIASAYTGTVEMGTQPPPMPSRNRRPSGPPPIAQPRPPAVKIKTAKKKKKMGMPLIVIIVLLLLGGGGFAAIKVMNSMGISIPNISFPNIPFVSDFFAPKVEDTTGTLKIKTVNVTNRFVDNEKIGRLFIITGEIKNDYPDTRRYIKLTGKLLSQGGKVSKTEWVYCGNTLDDLELSSLDSTAITNRLHKRYAGDLPPGKQLPFIVVFNELPPDMEEYTIEVSGSFPME